MALGTKLAKLHREHLRKWRQVLADHEIASTGHPGWGADVCARKLVEYYEFFEELKSYYLDDEDRELLITIGPIHGDIRIDEDG